MAMMTMAPADLRRRTISSQSSRRTACESSILQHHPLTKLARDEAALFSRKKTIPEQCLPRCHCYKRLSRLQAPKNNIHGFLDERPSSMDPASSLDYASA